MWRLSGMLVKRCRNNSLSQTLKGELPMQNINRKPTWELKNIIKALSLHSWLNTPKEELRLEQAKKELKRRNEQGFTVSNFYS